MKRRFSFLLATAMLMSMLTIPALALDYSNKWSKDTATSTPDEATHEVANLYAGQNLLVGHVYIDALGGNRYLVTYKVTAAEWFLTEIHFEAISQDDLAYVMTKRYENMIPGQFTVGQTFSLTDHVTTFSFYYQSIAEVTDFSAHAVVKQPAVYIDVPGTLTVASAEGNTLFSETEGVFDLLHLAVATWIHPVWPTLAGAEWIWETYQVDAPRLGDTLYFKRDFTVPGIVTSAELKIAADNDYFATINGLPTVPMTGDFVPVDPYNVLPYIQQGSNILNIKGVNWAWPTDSVTENPGAIIYKLDIGYNNHNLVTPERSESAWAYIGNPVRKPDGNWSAKFAITHHLLLVESVNVYANGVAAISPFVPADGFEYIIKATGTYIFAPSWVDPAGIADAKFNNRTGLGWVIGDSWSPPVTNWLQVMFENDPSGTIIGWQGDYNDDHIYTADIIGTGVPIKFQIYDTAYSDNSGFIRVEIFKWVIN